MTEILFRPRRTLFYSSIKASVVVLMADELSELALKTPIINLDFLVAKVMSNFDNVFSRFVLHLLEG